MKMPSWRVEMSLPCRDLRREEAVGASSRDRDSRTEGVCRAYPWVSVNARGSWRPRRDPALPCWPLAWEREPLIIQAEALCLSPSPGLVLPSKHHFH